MAQKTIMAHMKQRRDTLANWASTNPVLLDGELGIVTDDPNLYKVGNGSTAWNDLPFRGFDGTLVHHTGASATAVMSQKAVTDALSTKADPAGNYPQMTAGFAGNLVGRGEAVEATINFRASGGKSIEDGAARVKELKGNSVVWNQGFRAADFPDNAMSFWRGQHANISIVDGVCKMVATEAGSRAIYQNFQTPFGGTGHKVMVVCDFKRYSSASERFYVYLVLEDGAAEMPSQHFSDTNRRREVAFLTLTSGIKDAGIYPHLNGAVGDVVDIYSLTIYDLTQMFGTGNEPTTIEEFYSRIPQNVDLYAYNEGEIISTDAEGIKSVGFNAWDEQWEQGYYDTGRVGTTLLPVASTNRFRSKNAIKVLPNTQYCLMSDMDYLVLIFCDNDGIVLNEYAYGNGAVFTTPANCGYLHFFTYAQVANASYTGKICINLSHSGYRNGEYQPYVEFIRNLDSRIKEAFPNGMRSAGNTHDKVYNKNGKGYIEKRIGMVDLGNLEWYADSGRFNSSAIADIGGDIAYRYLNVLCRYTETMSGADKTFFVYENKQVFLYDSAYTDAASLKAALKGVPLYYELATPEVIEYDEPFNLDYEVWDFGTEQMLTSRPSAPIKASIVYGFNAVDSVRNAEMEIAELKTQIAQMQTLMASLTAQPAALAE